MLHGVKSRSWCDKMTICLYFDIVLGVKSVFLRVLDLHISIFIALYCYTESLVHSWWLHSKFNFLYLLIINLWWKWYSSWSYKNKTYRDCNARKYPQYSFATNFQVCRHLSRHQENDWLNKQTVQFSLKIFSSLCLKAYLGVQCPSVTHYNTQGRAVTHKYMTLRGAS